MKERGIFMNELTKTNQDLAKKEALGQYVHDMVDLEIRAFSLRKTAEKTRKEAERAEKNTNSTVDSAIKSKERTLEEKNFRERNSIVTFGDYCRNDKGYVIGCSLFWIIPLLIGIPSFFFDDESWIMGVVCLGLALIISSLHWGSCFSEFKKKSKLDKETLMRLQNDYEYWEKKLVSAQENRENVRVYVQALCSHADQLDKDIAEIESTLQKNYALNIIPPDYRRLECLVWIDYAFRNDQVDTMREATLQCDKWVRHNDTMKALKELAENIRSVAVLLENMNSNISMMNQDLFRIAEAQEKQLSESQSARYAMESVQKSTERLAMYEDMKRAGTF